VVFADLEADLWGILIDGEHPVVSVSSLSGAEPSFVPAAVQHADAGELTVVAPGLALRVQPSGEPSSSTESAGQLELVQVSGAATLDGVEREVELGGLTLRSLSVDGADSVRLFAGWFAADRTLGLVATRAKDAKGHDRDEIEVASTGEEQPVVFDPRLSTTYDEHGLPLRIGIELWLADSPEAEENQARRVAAQATGSRVQAPGSPPAVSAHALRCVSRSEAGAGVYLIARARS